jgi:hypothetical protein
MPELAGGEGRALRQCFELGPGDLRMDAAADPAIGRGDDALPADEIRKPNNALGDEFGVLDDVGSMTDDAGQDQLVVGEFDGSSTADSG